MPLRLAGALLLALAVAGLADVAAAAEPVAAEPRTPVSELLGPVPLLRVLDGDTIEVVSNIGPRKVRLIGIDAPETSGVGAEGGEEGRAAAAHLATLLGSGMLLWIELDLETEDRYGRLLAYVYVPDAAGEWDRFGIRLTQVNQAMAAAGWARPLTIEPNVTYADLYRSAAAEARAAERGVWSRAAEEPAGAEPGAAAEGEGEPPVRLHCGLINPDAPNDVGEWISVMLGREHDTRGYYLYDEGSRAVFRLPSGVQPAGQLRIHNPGQGVWNNSGDVVYLMRAGEVVDSWSYRGDEVVRGEVLCRDGGR